jgi:hypothetical protein
MERRGGALAGLAAGKAPPAAETVVFGMVLSMMFRFERLGALHPG